MPAVDQFAAPVQGLCCQQSAPLGGFRHVGLGASLDDAPALCASSIPRLCTMTSCTVCDRPALGLRKRGFFGSTAVLALRHGPDNLSLTHGPARARTTTGRLSATQE